MAPMAIETLQAEVAHNVDHLRAELAQIDEPDAGPPESGLAFAAYEAADLSHLDAGTQELVGAFYQTLAVAIEGHPGFLDADPDELDQSYRIILEAAIDLGDQIGARFRDQASDAA